VHFRTFVCNLSVCFNSEEDEVDEEGEKEQEVEAEGICSNILWTENTHSCHCGSMLVILDLFWITILDSLNIYTTRCNPV
jgi:hypothetical protein